LSCISGHSSLPGLLFPSQWKCKKWDMLAAEQQVFVWLFYFIVLFGSNKHSSFIPEIIMIMVNYFVNYQISLVDRWKHEWLSINESRKKASNKDFGFLSSLKWFLTH
jgi:hypothetical protein